MTKAAIAISDKNSSWRFPWKFMRRIAFWYFYRSRIDSEMYLLRRINCFFLLREKILFFYVYGFWSNDNSSDAWACKKENYFML